MAEVTWPAWDPTARPADLPRYIVPAELDYLGIPEDRDGAGLPRLRRLWERLRRRDNPIEYAHEPVGAPAGSQLIREPCLVLGENGVGTCLDLALVLAAACLRSGLRAAVITLRPAAGRAGSGHAVVAVLLGDSWPGGDPDARVWMHAPAAFAERVMPTLDSAHGDILVLDPNGIARPVPRGLLPVTGLGLDTDLDTAAQRGAGYLTSQDHTWVVGGLNDTDVARFTPTRRPAVPPLRESIYRDPDTAESPLRRIRAEYALTPFQPSDALDVVLDTCARAQATRRSRLLVLHGAGGAGKTRIALEAAHRLRELGWYAGLLTEHVTAPDPSTADDQPTSAWHNLSWLASVHTPTFVVVDYADARTDETKALLTAIRARTGGPAVVLLTARATDGDWLTSITDHLESNSLGLSPAIFELADRSADDADVFRETYRALGNNPHALPPAPPRQDRWTTLDLVLLAWFAAENPEQPLPADQASLYEEVLRHERRYWVKAYEGRGYGAADRQVLDDAASTVTALAPTSAAAYDALAAVPKLEQAPEWRNRVTTVLSTCLDPGAGEALALRPDPVGDHFLLGHFAPSTPTPAHTLLFDRIVAQAAAAGRLPRLLAVLTRAGQQRGAAGRAHADPRATGLLVRATQAAAADSDPPPWLALLAVAVNLGGAAEDAFRAVIPGLTDESLLQASNALPRLSTVGAGLALAVDEQRLTHLAADIAPEARAGLLLTVSERRRLAGGRAGALAAIDEAVTLRRGLTDPDTGNPAAYTPDLAGSLNNQAALRAAVGDRAGALAAINEAVTLYRGLTDPDTGNPAAYTPDLAGSLNNQAALRAAVGDRAGALAAINEAVTLYRGLADPDTGNPAAYTPDLAGSLNNQAALRAEVGDRAGALAAIDEAVTLRRGLADPDTGNPAAYTPDLAGSLNNQATQRAAVGDRAGALAAIDEAVTLDRGLADPDTGNPAAYTPNLAGSLNNQATQRAEVGDRAGALAAINEAVTLYRGLTDPDTGNPAAYTPKLAMSLNNQAALRAEVGDRAGALAAINEAVTLRRELADPDTGNPAAYTPDLAMSLNNQAALRAEVGDRAGALAAIDEAVTLYRGLADPDTGNPAAYTPDLAASLNNQANLRAAVGDRAGALAAIDEAVTLYRGLADPDTGNPAAYTPDLAASLNNQATLRAEVGDRAGALAAIDEAVTLRRGLADPDTGNPAAYTPDLAASLNNQANLRAAVGDRAGALAAIDEAVTLYRGLADPDTGNPAAYTPDLAASLNNQANLRAAVGDRAGALAAIDEAVTLDRGLADPDTGNPAAYTPDLAGSLNNQANLRAEVGDRAGALAAINEAVTLYRGLADPDTGNPAAYTPDLAMSLNNQANLRAEVGDRAGALAAINEAVTLYRGLADPDTGNPAAYTPDLAASLNNQANRRAEVGDRAGALAAINEAVTLYRGLADPDTGNPAAYTPDLAASLNNQANRRAEVGDRAGALAAINEAVTLRRELADANAAAFTSDLIRSLHAATEIDGPTVWARTIGMLRNPHTRALLWAAYATWLTDNDTPDTAHDAARQALTDAAAVTLDNHPAYAIRQLRHAVRAAVQHSGLQDPDAPGWAAAAIPDDVVDLLNQWAGQPTWPERKQVLLGASDILSRPTTREALTALGDLYPGDPNIQQLAAVVATAHRDGLDATIAGLKDQHATATALHAWITTDTWTASFTALHADQDRLTSDASLAQLAAWIDDTGPDPTLLQHIAILHLTRTHGIDICERIVTTPTHAATHALTATDTGDLHLAHRITLACPAMLLVPSRGPFLAALLLTAGGQLDAARHAARECADTSNDIERHARLINLRHLREHLNDDIRSALEPGLASIQEELDNTSR